MVCDLGSIIVYKRTLVCQGVLSYSSCSINFSNPQLPHRGLVARTIAVIWYYLAAPPSVHKQITRLSLAKAQPERAATAELKD